MSNEQKLVFIKKFKIRSFDIDNRIYSSPPEVLIHEFSILCLNKMINKCINNIICGFEEKPKEDELTTDFINDEYNVTHFGLEKDMFQKMKPLISDVSRRTNIEDSDIEDTLKTIINHMLNVDNQEWQRLNYTEYLDGPIWGQVVDIPSRENVSDILYKNNLVIDGIPFFTINYLPQYISLNIEKYANKFIEIFYKLDRIPGFYYSRVRKDLPYLSNRFMINWLSVPEYIQNYSRCIQSVSKSNISALSTPDETSQYIDPTTGMAKIRLFNSRRDLAEGSQNCNIFNLISFFVFRRILDINSLGKLIFHVAHDNVSIIKKPIGQPEQRSLFFLDTDTLITEEDDYEIPIKDEQLEEFRISQLPLEIE